MQRLAAALRVRRLGRASFSKVPESVEVEINSNANASPPALQSALGMGLSLPPSRAPLFRPSPLSAFARRYEPLLAALGVFSRRAAVGQASDDLWRSLEEQATQECWFGGAGGGAGGGLGLRRTWAAEHALLALHVWIVHCRLKVDYNVRDAADAAEGGHASRVVFSGRQMMDQLFSRFWEDTTLRIRNAGIQELSVNRQLGDVQKATFHDFFEYDGERRPGQSPAVSAPHARHPDPPRACPSLPPSLPPPSLAPSPAALRVEGDEDRMELAAAVWRAVFREDEAADSEAVLRLADYVQRETTSLLLQPREDVYRGWVMWGPCVGESAAQRLARQRSMLAGEWRDALDPAGRVFFYHTATHERRWTPPDEGLYPRRRFQLMQYLADKPECARRIGDSGEALRRAGLGAALQQAIPELPGRGEEGAAAPAGEAVSSASSSASSAPKAGEVFGKRASD